MNGNGLYPNHANAGWRGCDPNPDCVGSRCCPDRVPVSGAELPVVAPELGIGVGVVPGARGIPQPGYVPMRPEVANVETGWTTRCDHGMCADTTSTISAGGRALGHIGADKTVNNFVVPKDSFGARRMMAVADLERGGGWKSQAQLNADWDTQGIRSLRSSPEFNDYAQSLVPLFGDAAMSVATRNMAMQEGMGGAYSGSGYFANDNAARHQEAQRLQSGAYENRESTRMFEALGLDPSAFGGEAVGFDSNGLPFTAQQQGDGEFAYADSPAPRTMGDYGAGLSATGSVTPAHAQLMGADRAVGSKAATEMLKQGSGIRKAEINAGARVSVADKNNAAKLAVANIRTRIKRLDGTASRQPLSYEQQKELIRLRGEEKRLTQDNYLKNSGKYNPAVTVVPD